MLLEICFKDHKDEFIKKLIHYGRDEEASSDAVQEAFLRAMENREYLENLGENALKAWIYVTSKNIFIDNKRRQSKITSYDFEEPYDLKKEDMVSILKNSYVSGLVVAFDENALRDALDMNLKLKSKDLLTTKEIFSKYGEVLSSENHTFLKENHEVIREDIVLDDSIYAIYGDKIYVMGDLKLNPQDEECLKDFSSIIVKGYAKLPVSSFKCFKEIGKADDVLLYKGELLDIDGSETISKVMLETAKASGITYTINVDGKLKFNEDVLPENLSCISSIYNDGMIEVSDSLKPFVIRLIKKGDGVVKSPSDSKDKKLNFLTDDEWVKINTGTFVL